MCSKRTKDSMYKPKDKNGKTEEQFLREYDVTQYFRPSVTVDALLYRRLERGARVLMIRRGGHPYIGRWAFPGGFVDADEPCETAVARELAEETGITGVALRQLVTVSTPGRDPRWRNITAVFCAETDELDAVGGDDAERAAWFDIEYRNDGGNAELAFTGAGESFTARLAIVRDAFGRVDINNTRITDAGNTAFDHAKILALLLDGITGGDGK